MVISASYQRYYSFLVWTRKLENQPAHNYYFPLSCLFNACNSPIRPAPFKRMPRAPQKEHFPNGKSGEREKKCQKKYVKSRNICDTTPKRLPIPQFAQTDCNMFQCPISAMIHNLTHILHTYTSHITLKLHEKGGKKETKRCEKKLISTCCSRNAAQAGKAWLQSTLNFFQSDCCKKHQRTLHLHFVR